MEISLPSQSLGVKLLTFNRSLPCIKNSNKVFVLQELADISPNPGVKHGCWYAPTLFCVLVHKTISEMPVLEIHVRDRQYKISKLHFAQYFLIYNVAEIYVLWRINQASRCLWTKGDCASKHYKFMLVTYLFLIDPSQKSNLPSCLPLMGNHSTLKLGCQVWNGPDLPDARVLAPDSTDIKEHWTIWIDSSKKNLSFAYFHYVAHIIYKVNFLSILNFAVAKFKLNSNHELEGRFWSPHIRSIHSVVGSGSYFWSYFLNILV